MYHFLKKKKKSGMDLWQWHCRKWGGKMWFRNLERVKKKVLRSQYFHNKSHVISYY